MIRSPLLVVARVVRPRPRTADRRVDWAGAALGTALLATVTFAVIESGAWLLVVGVVLLAVFITVEHATADPTVALFLVAALSTVLIRSN